jgi:hypothetical protein
MLKVLKVTESEQGNLSSTTPSLRDIFDRKLVEHQDEDGTQALHSAYYLKDTAYYVADGTKMLRCLKKVRFEDLPFLMKMTTHPMFSVMFDENMKVDGLNVGMSVANYRIIYNGNSAVKTEDFDIIQSLLSWIPNWIKPRCSCCSKQVILPRWYPKVLEGLGTVSAPLLGINGAGGSFTVCRPTKLCLYDVMAPYGRFCFWMNDPDHKYTNENAHEQLTAAFYRITGHPDKDSLFDPDDTFGLKHHGVDTWFHSKSMVHAHAHFASAKRMWTVKGLDNWGNSQPGEEDDHQFSVLEMLVMDHVYNVARNITEGNGDWFCHHVRDYPEPVSLVMNNLSLMVANIFSTFLHMLSYGEMPPVGKYVKQNRYQSIHDYLRKICHYRRNYVLDKYGDVVFHSVFEKK